MQGVVTTPQARRPGWASHPETDVAVKTGTAQVGNAAQNTVDWMIGFAPANNPTVAVAVVVPEQATSASGAEIAGPIMKAMIEAALAEQAADTPTPTTHDDRRADHDDVPHYDRPRHADDGAADDPDDRAPPTTTTVPPTSTTAAIPTTTTPFAVDHDDRRAGATRAPPTAATP